LSAAILSSPLNVAAIFWAFVCVDAPPAHAVIGEMSASREIEMAIDW
jgi:hypothetical protein